MSTHNRAWLKVTMGCKVLAHCRGLYVAPCKTALTYINLYMHVDFSVDMSISYNVEIAMSRL